MKKNMLIVILVAIVAGCASVAGTAWFLKIGPFAGADTHQSEDIKKNTSSKDRQYVTLDKVVILLNDSGKSSRSRYLAMDVVFSVDDEKQAKEVKEELPMLRSGALRALSGLTPEYARSMTLDDIVKVLSQEYEKTYGGKESVPYGDVFIAKLMIE